MPPVDPAERFGPIEVQGHSLHCHVCSHSVFWEREIGVAAPISNLLTFDAWSGVAQCAICVRCGHVHMFIAPETFREAEESSDGQMQEGNA